MANAFVFNPEVIGLLQKAGWYEGRNAVGAFSLPSDVQYPPDIIQVLNEFGGLFVHSSGTGISLSRLSINFEPSWADKESSEDGILWDYATRLGYKLYPLGYIADESLMLCMDLDGKIYMVGDYLYLVGESFSEGIGNVLLGIEGKQLNEETLYWE